MRNDPLTELLRHADAGQPPPAATPDLANRVRRRARRGRVTRHVVTAALLIFVGGAALWFRPTRVESPMRVVTSRVEPKTRAVDISALRREYARLNADADLHQRTAERILARQRVKQSNEVADASDALSAQLERSALTLVNRGDNLLHDPTARAQAVESFRRVLELFPRSRGAALARDRLAQIGA